VIAFAKLQVLLLLFRRLLQDVASEAWPRESWIFVGTDPEAPFGFMLFLTADNLPNKHSRAQISAEVLPGLHLVN
jgi:hypothetical protein